MLSNSASTVVRELYAGYRFDRVSTTRSISCATTKRGPVDELVVRNYSEASRSSVYDLTSFIPAPALEVCA
jgi:hypothetical protein